ncbi:DUF1731 domain-containing protein [Cryobacterium aureum]|uniref:DUF1731 domain-containing protein n=1 Tax=Cryobacterium aureum TaxID=995037 RepID=UPI000CF450C4
MHSARGNCEAQRSRRPQRRARSFCRLVCLARGKHSRTRGNSRGSRIYWTATRPLKSRWVTPERLLQAGYTFTWTDLGPAITDVVKR